MKKFWIFIFLLFLTLPVSAQYLFRSDVEFQQTVTVTDTFFANSYFYAKNGNEARYADMFAGADAGAKIQAALNDLPSTGGIVDCRGLVGTQTISSPITRAFNAGVKFIFGPTTFNCTNTAFKFRSGWIFEGSGSYTLFQGDSLGATKPIFVSADTTTRWYDIVIRDLVVDNLVSDSGILIDLRKVSTSIVQNVWGRNAAVGIKMNDTAYYNLCLNNYITSVKRPYRIYGGANENTIMEGRANGDPVGIEIDNATNCMVIGTAIEFSGADTGIKISPTTATQYTKIDGVRIEGNGTGIGIQIGSTAQTITVINPMILGVTTQINNLAGGYLQTIMSAFGSPTFDIDTLQFRNGSTLRGSIYGNADGLFVQAQTGALTIPRITTAQRDALTAVNGMIIYNSTTNAFNFYENGVWVIK